MKVYLDNAATTSLRKEVIDEMLPFMQEQYGNPSSIHAYGREVRSKIEKGRKSISKLLNCSPSEVYFTSSGTEANNTIIKGYNITILESDFDLCNGECWVSYDITVINSNRSSGSATSIQ